MKRMMIALLVLSTGILAAEGWETSGDMNLNLTQNAYSDNWAGDEKSSVSWVFNANLSAQKQLTAKVHNKTSLKMAFGQTHNQYLDAMGEKQWQKPDKTTDLIDLESIARFTLGSYVDPFVGVRWESQFLDESGSETKAMNPNTFTESFGVARVFIKKEKQELSSRFGGAFRQFVDANADETTNDGGLEWITEFTTPLAGEVMTYNTKLEVFKALYNSESDVTDGTAYEDDWAEVQMNWEHILTAQVSKYISFNIYAQLVYDKTDLDTGYIDTDYINGKPIDELQFKETLGLGITYKLF
jgi:hypothetical protein